MGFKLLTKNFLKLNLVSLASINKKHIHHKMNVIPIEALSDNYMYLLVDQASNECAAVDPVEPKKVLKIKF